MKIADNINKREAALEQLSVLDAMVKQVKAAIMTLEVEILAEATDNMVSDITHNGYKYSFKNVSKVFIKDRVSDHSGKVEVMNRLGELGFDEAVYFPSAYYDAIKLKKIWNALPFETKNQWMTDGLIYVETIPQIKKLEVKNG